MNDRDQREALPELGGAALAFFRRHFPRFIRKNFGGLWIEESSLARIRNLRGGAIVLFNHPSWWDAVTGPSLGWQLFPGSRHFGPIDARALERYGFMKKVGFFGVDGDSGKGLRDFVRIGREVTESDDAFLWVTPQGEFTDFRERPVRFKPGVGHLAARASEGIVIPLAIEYLFGEERWPDIYCRFGEPVAIAEHPGLDPDGWTSKLEQSLEDCQDQLAVLTRARQFETFSLFFEGRRGTGGFYGWWQKMGARLRGQEFNPRHASIDEEKKLHSRSAS